MSVAFLYVGELSEKKYIILMISPVNKFRWHNVIHKFRVFCLLFNFARKLLWRAIIHDWSKFSSYEAALFGPTLPRLQDSSFTQKSYAKLLEELEPALVHHYAHNRHHPQHFKELGVRLMILLDVVEMFYDWKASTKKHKDGDILASITHNTERFNLGGDLEAILRNTAWEEM